MACYQGTRFARNFTVRDSSTDLPVDISGWRFKAQLRDQPQDEFFVLELTSDNGGFAIIDAEAGRFTMAIAPEQSALLPAGTMNFDVLRTDPADGPYYLFAGRFKVKQPVTREDEVIALGSLRVVA